MSQPLRKARFAALLAALYGAALSSDVVGQEKSAGPRIGLAFVELPSTIEQLRYVFACQDGLQIEARWIAENVGDVAPPDTLIGSVEMNTRGPLNVAQLTRPANGWPLGLYRLELWHNQKPFHTVRYVIEDLEARPDK